MQHHGGAGLSGSDQPPTAIHLAEGEAPVQAAGFDQVVRQHTDALSLIKFFTVNTIAHRHGLKR